MVPSSHQTAAPNRSLEELKGLMGIDPQSLSASIEEFIRRHVSALEREGVILGLSGGIDSTLTTALCVRAVGPEKVLALLMPDRDSDRRHLRDAQHFSKTLGIRAEVIELTPYLKKLRAYPPFTLKRLLARHEARGESSKKFWELYKSRSGETPYAASIVGFKDRPLASHLRTGVARARIKHRLRMLLLYQFAEQENRLVVGAANKTELSVGFFVKQGCDQATDIMPILGLYKTQVLTLAGHLSISSDIMDKAPSPDMIPGITDEIAIGLPHQKLDLILLALEKGWERADIAGAVGVAEQEVDYVRSLVHRSAHMRTVCTLGRCIH